MPERSLIADPWTPLRRHTSARIAIGRAGASLPTGQWLEFSLAHAAARDAVHSVLDPDRLEADLRALHVDVIRLTTRAPDRLTYLQRPDLGRRLSEPSAAALASVTSGVDLSISVGDGLSALAAQRHVPGLLALLLPLVRSSGFSLAPLTMIEQARVAAQDEVGHLLRARAALILLGERPGLGSPDSLGAYLVYAPRPGRTDAERNCVSNIRPDGLPLDDAAATIHYLVTQSFRRQLSGIHLKDNRPLPTAGRVSPELPS
jgi:ethanolamine ammonia-lyase small subunit